jgi:hypothetical protein
VRCWQCKRIVAVPERVIPDTGKYSQTSCTEVECSCGSRYSVTISRLPRVVHVEAEAPDPELKRGWQ